jgi:hypothetical protein
LATATPFAAERRALCSAALAAPWLLGACAMPLTAALPAAGEVGVPVEVAAGVYMLQGASGEAAPENAGRVGNAGFIVGPAGVVVVDSGTSYQEGVALLASIRRITSQPVRLLLLTHTRQEFLFGAAAFAEQRIPVQMQTQAARLMAARCEGCLKALKRLLGEEAMRGTTVVKPDVLFDTSTTLDLIGRPLRLLHFGHSSGPGMWPCWTSARACSLPVACSTTSASPTCRIPGCPAGTRHWPRWPACRCAASCPAMALWPGRVWWAR